MKAGDPSIGLKWGDLQKYQGKCRSFLKKRKAQIWKMKSRLDSDNDNDESTEEDEEEEDDDNEEENGDGGKQMDDIKNAEMEELEKEYMDLRDQEQDLLRNLKHHKDEDLLKGQAVKKQKTLWDKTMEFRFLLQNPFSSSNRLPQVFLNLLGRFCDTDNKVNEAYSDLIASSKVTLHSIMELLEEILEKNSSIIQSADVNSGRNTKCQDASENHNVDGDEERLQISQMHSRMVPFRNKSVDKWRRKTQLTTGTASIKGKLHAFNQVFPLDQFPCPPRGLADHLILFFC